MIERTDLHRAKSLKIKYWRSISSLTSMRSSEAKVETDETLVVIEEDCEIWSSELELREEDEEGAPSCGPCTGSEPSHREVWADDK
jgi:heterodisulfide reductase subunit C